MVYCNLARSTGFEPATHGTGNRLERITSTKR